jgi:arylsulfatase
MFRNPRLQLVAVLAIGALLGYACASGQLGLNPQANATAQTVSAMAATQAAALAPARADEAIVFEVLLPANALLEIDGDKTKETGESRTFSTPPLKVGERYNYTLKATAGEKVVTRQIHLAHGAANSIDLRPDFRAAGVVPAKATSLTKQPASSKKPNIVFIMGDDVGWFNIGAYHRGIMSGKTPNLDKLAAQGMLFTDYYAEASCTAGRASFITGEIPLRTGLTTVGQAGADVGMPAQACTLATALKAQGYLTCQHGKNHLGDLNKYLPTLHGFDEFFGYLYHLDAMSDPFWYSFPSDPAFFQTYGPRNLVHCTATEVDDPTVMTRWGKVGKQKVVDEGPLRPFKNMTADHQGWQEGPPGSKYDMETFDEVLVERSKAFMDKAKKEGKPFFLWHNTTRMHVFTYLSPKYQKTMNYKTNYGLEEAGMTQLDDSVGALMKHLDDIGEADNTILIFSTDNGAEVFTWPDGGMTPFKATKGTVMEGGFRAPCIARWPGHIKPGTVENGIFSGLDWFPTLAAAAGNPNITDELLKGVKLGERTYKNHLDGYNQLDVLLGKGPSKRHEFFYFGGPHLGALRIDDMKFQFYQQPQGWPGPKVTTDMPTIVNLRQDPFERTPSIGQQSLNDLGGGYMNDFYAREFWRFVFVQQKVGELAKTAIDYPPMQDPASFNLDAIKKQIETMIKNKQGQ